MPRLINDFEGTGSWSDRPRFKSWTCVLFNRVTDWRTRFGVYQPLVLVGGTLGVAAAISTLISFWIWGIGRDHSGMWATVVITDWGTRLITLSSTVIRACVGAQTIICCMILATLALEHGLVIYKDAAAMSMLQYSTSGPFNMTFPLLRGARPNTHLFSKRYFGLVFLVGLATVNIVIQFTSTLLVSDTSNWSVYGREEYRSVGYGIENYIMYSQYGLYQRPPEFPTFAEGLSETEAFKIVEGAGSIDWIDSGSHIRALIPLPKVERESLVRYSGPALAIDPHVMCVAHGPEELGVTVGYQYIDMVTGNLSLTVDKVEKLPKPASVSNLYWKVHFSGSFNIPSMIKYSERLRNGNSTQFAAALDRKLKANCSTAMDATTLCPLNSLYLWPSENSDFTYDEFEGETAPSPIPNMDKAFNDFPARSVLDIGNSWILVSRASISKGANASISDIGRAFEAFLGSEATFNGSEWMTRTSESGDVKVTVEQSLCISSFKYRSVMIDITRREGSPEPHMLNWPDSGYNTSSVGMQLIARYSSELRGIFHLWGWSSISDVTDRTAFGDGVIRWMWHFVRLGGEDPVLCPAGPGSEECRYSPYYMLVSSALEAIYLDVLDRTQDLSQGLQSVFMLITGSSYFDHQVMFNLEQFATYTKTQTYPIPRKFLGLAVVLLALCLHFILLCSLLLLWSRGNKQSGVASERAPRTLGQSWQSIAVVGCGAAQQFLAKASKEPDQHLGKKLGINGWNHTVEVRHGEHIGIYPSSEIELSETYNTRYRGQGQSRGMC